MTYYQLEQRDRDYLDSLFKQFKDELDWACTTTDRRARCAPYPDEWELVDLVRSLVRYGRIAQLGITCKGTEDIQIYHEYLTCQEWFARITYTHSHRSENFAHPECIQNCSARLKISEAPCPK